MNYPAASCETSQMSFRLGRNLSDGFSEGFPTSGNDRTREILTPMQNIEGFLD